MPAVKSWGPRRSGTNVFGKVLDEYTDASRGVPGWKHGVPGDPPDADAHLIHTKHPYAWLLSMERWWAVHETLDRWMVRMHARWDARDAVMRAHATRLDAYAGRLQGWLARLPDDKTVLVRYEDVLSDAAEVVSRVADVAGLEVASTPRLPGQRVNSRGERTDSSFDPTYYTQRRWAGELHPGEVTELDGYLDETGYRPLFENTLGYDMDV